MGGKPVTALNLAFFPSCALELGILKDMLAGGKSMLDEAGVALAGGHTVEDDELKYGMAVSGIVHPDRIVRNSTARPGDRLILTKPLGTGIVATAVKAEMSPPDVAAEAERWMTILNREAAMIMVECGASACTDVTGFGLIGHALEMAKGAGAAFRLERRLIPLIPGVEALAGDGLVPAGCYRNRDFFSRCIGASVATADDLLPLFDPQTSGGLLIALPPRGAERFLEIAGGGGSYAVMIGEVAPCGEHLIEIY
jgi:selenide,water dikinase